MPAVTRRPRVRRAPARGPSPSEVDPQRLLVGHERGDGEHRRVVAGRSRRRVDEAREVRRPAPRVHRRDQHAARAPRVPRHLEEALERRRGRLHDELDVERGKARRAPSSTQSRSCSFTMMTSGVMPAGVEVPNHATRSGARPATSTSGFGHGEPVPAEAAALARRDDAARQPSGRVRAQRVHSVTARPPPL